ncbi:hypothetical protein CYY_009968 [Polysphondylium violaceum]|uniref:MGS-like domain-containing protein n=1 Tax=Polysphondylium violaceum TaxID=133409 RepID=A0A8J4PKJ6_9MYCE|nr:hypothetical protein CYY_009968 [Polysphondylium violaceum]
MEYTTRTIGKQKHIALIAHDNCKKSLLDWVNTHKNQLANHTLYATGTTGHLVEKATGLSVKSMLSGPLGGDQQIGALIAEGKIDLLLFFFDPMASQPHDPDIKALLRISAVWNIPVATNKSTADFLMSSLYFNSEITIDIPDYQKYLQDRFK